MRYVLAGTGEHTAIVPSMWQSLVRSVVALVLFLIHSTKELLISAGVFAVGFLVFTLLVEVATPITLGEFRARDALA
jgi:hypothetical protein